MWFWLAIASSVFGAFDVILAKKVLPKVSSAVLTWSIFTFSIPILFYLVLKEGAPDINVVFFLATASSSVIYIFSKTINNTVLRQNLISKILPLASFNGIFTYIFGLLLLSESIRLIPILGLLSIISGAYIMNVDQARESIWKPFKLLFTKGDSALFLLTILMSSIAVVLDKTALNNTAPSSPVFTMLIEQTIMSALLGIYLIKSENKTWTIEVKRNFTLLFLNSFIFLIGGLLVFYAYAVGGPVALVFGIRRIQIIFILVMSHLFFKDKPTKHTWIATAIMILGILMIKLG